MQPTMIPLVQRPPKAVPGEIYRKSWEWSGDTLREVRHLVVLNCGAGRQSAYLALEAAQRHLAGEHVVDLVVMADTGHERKATLRYWEQVITPALDAAGIPHRLVGAEAHRSNKGKFAGRLRRSGGGIAADTLRSVAEGTPIANAPLWVAKKGEGQKGSPLKRACTSEYKIAPITAEVKRVLRLKVGNERARNGKTRRLRCDVVQWIGIATEEQSRATDTMKGESWISLAYPLLERGMSTDDCLAWLAGHGYPQPVKSACIGCPYRSDASWAQMAVDDPESFSLAVEYDARLRDPLGLGRLNDGLSLSDYYDGRTPAVKGAEHPAYLHPSCTPLGEIDFSGIDITGPESFGGEC